ncbi:unnamed protein product [Allacma fusca]|nr:unnamed protein product [Allacma fusca]
MYSDEDDLGDDDLHDKNSSSGTSSSTNKPMTQAEKRAHHNALERKRRDHIKDSFTNLRDSVPALHGEKVSKRISSRAQILKKAAEYIQFMRRKNSAHQHDIEDLKRQNHILENQIRSLESARMSGNVRTNSLSSSSGLDLKVNNHLSESDGSDGEMHSSINSPSATSSNHSPTKKIKVMNVGSSSGNKH